KDLDSATCSTRPEAKPREPDRFLVRPLISEPARDNEPVRDRESVTWSVRLEDSDNEPDRLLARPLISEPARDNEPDKDLESETCSARLEDRHREPDRLLARPLISEAAIDREPDRDLSHEVCSTRPEVIVKVEVRLAEHERGLELQISFPESTLATMLPIVKVIEAASVLKKEFFSTRLETIASEPLKDLNREILLAKADV